MQVDEDGERRRRPPFLIMRLAARKANGARASLPQCHARDCQDLVSRDAALSAKTHLPGRMYSSRCRRRQSASNGCTSKRCHEKQVCAERSVHGVERRLSIRVLPAQGQHVLRFATCNSQFAGEMLNVRLVSLLASLGARPLSFYYLAHITSRCCDCQLRRAY